jgi:ABC-type Fe3+-siderophore transport system permease subunit
MTDNNNDFATKFANALEGMFESVALTRKQHFIDNPTKRPSQQDIDSIVKRYANQNAVIAGAANLIPGPLGMLAALPELIAVIGNQIQMIYDLGVAHGKEANLSSELLLGIFSTVIGERTIGLVTVKGSQLLLKKASVQVLQKIVFWLGGSISQKLLKRFVAKWLPIVGVVAMVLWSRQSTIEMGEKASKMLAMTIVNSEEEVTINEIPID